MTQRVRTLAWTLPPDAYGRRHLEVSQLASGDVSVAGHDIGAALPGGTSEYEYAWTIPGAEIAELVTALGGGPGEDVLALLVAGFPTNPSARLGPFFEEHGIHARFWSRYGDD